MNPRQSLAILICLAAAMLPRAAHACNTLTAGFTSPGTGFTVYVGRQVNLQFQVYQCGSNAAVTGGSVTANFSNQDPQVTLTYQNGAWTGTWTPINAGNCPLTNPNCVIVTVNAVTGGYFGGQQWGGVVLPPPAPLTFDRSSLPFQTTAGGTASSQTINVTNNQAQAQVFTVQATGGSWIAVSPTAVSLPAGGSAPLQITVNPASLTANSYNATVTVAAPTASASASVNVAVAPPANPPVLTLDNYNLSLTATAGDPPLSQTVNVINSNPVSSSFTIQSVPSWVTVTPASGTVAAAGSQPMQIQVTPGSMAPGSYAASLTVASTGGLTMQLGIALTLIAPLVVTPPQLSVSPSNLSLSGTAGGSPLTATLAISNPTSQALNFTITSDSSWLSVSPASGLVPANGTLGIFASANPTDPTDLSPASYAGSLTISSGSSAPLPVSVAFSVALASSGALPCVPNVLLIAFPTLQSGQTVALGQPTAIVILLEDNCGNPVNGSSPVAVQVEFSDGAPAIRPTSVGNGQWSGTWTPAKTGLVTLTVTAIEIVSEGTSSRELASQTFLSLNVLAATGTPLVTSVYSGSTFQVPNIVSPGELVSIFGNQLADCTASEPLPLPVQACGAQLLLGGQPLPLLYVSPTQINAQVPYGIATNTSLQLVVQRDATLSTPFSVLVANAQPGIFTTAETGSGQAIIVDYTSGAIADSNHPATPGDFLVIYCSGLGTVSPAVPAGSPAPTPSPTNPSQLSTVPGLVTVTVGGQSALVFFAGLTPGFVGLYQIDAVVPAGVSGSAVPVVLGVAGQNSPPVTIAIQ